MDKEEQEIETRLEFDIYVMGEMKFEFINFLTECYKDNFFETLSWGNFRRYQLLLSNENRWLNIYFIFLKNELNSDILINSFKIYEKRNITLLLYNIHDQKSEKIIDMLNETLLYERNKFYEGILNEDNVHESLAKLHGDEEIMIGSDDVKEGLKFLNENEDNLLIKVGFSPFNKKSKVAKKDGNTYSVQSELFYVEDEAPTNFYGLTKHLLSKYFELFMIEDKVENYLDFAFTGTDNKIDKKQENDMMNYFVKIINCLIGLYIIACFYKFIISDNL
jgi:hypothetical protein